MARYNKLEVLNTISETGMIPVYYHHDLETVCSVAKACYEGGIRVFEFTNRGDYAHEIFGSLIKFAERECPGLIVGAGSIVDAPTAALYIQLGADFIVGPLFNPDVAKVCNRRCIPYSPGCGTASEIGYAQEAGCDLCKVFPAETTGGAAFVKNILAPMPWSMIMVTGGVEPDSENITEWFKAGVTCVGMGSRLISGKEVEEKQWKKITQRCKDTLGYISKAKENIR